MESVRRRKRSRIREATGVEVDMAFVSYKYSHYDNNQYYYTFVDSEFGTIETSIGETAIEEIVLVREYEKRNLPVGRNIALLILYMHKHKTYDIGAVRKFQDINCPNYIENWEQYAKERDYHLEKLLALT